MNEQMNIVVVGHVDHGKSTVIGRLLADTKSLSEGKLEQIQEKCRRESKEFEYAFLLDALKDEQSQGITIDSARVFFKTNKRRYIIIDAPGHIEFLKNMISGAARAEAALLVIDADEGIQENSKRHAYMLAMLGIRQVIVCVNKMDLVNYDREVFDSIMRNYKMFLCEIGIEAKMFLPVSARNGDNISQASSRLPWFNGMSVLGAIDSFEKEKVDELKPLRMPVQDVYKFTREGDSRRIISGRVESGSVKIGDKVVFLPSNKVSTVKTIEEFNSSRNQASAGYSTGFTLTEQIFLNRGEIMCKQDEERCKISSLFEASVFWMGKSPLVLGREYKIKLGTSSLPMKIKQISSVLDASRLSKESKSQVDRHEVATCIIETQYPMAFDLSSDLQSTSRFVIVDGYDIVGGGIITGSKEDKQDETRHQVFIREQKWEPSDISPFERAERSSQTPKLVLITGPSDINKKVIAKGLEKELFAMGRNVYFLGIGNLLRGVDADIAKEKRSEHLRRLGEVSHILLDAGLIVVATASDLSQDDFRLLETVLGKEDLLTVTVNQDYENSCLGLQDEDGIQNNIVKIIDLLKFKNVVYNSK